MDGRLVGPHTLRRREGGEWATLSRLPRRYVLYVTCAWCLLCYTLRSDTGMWINGNPTCTTALR